MKKEVLSFLVVGVINTVLHWIVYWTLLSYFEHQISFAVAFFVGTLISLVLNSKKTFDVALSPKKMVLYFLFYIVSYLFGRTILYVCVDLLSIDAYVAIIFVTAVNIPVNFLGSRWVLKGVIRPTSS
jgi:putative flippase GtrA